MSLVLFATLALIAYVAWLLEPFRLSCVKAVNLRNKINTYSNDRLIKKYRMLTHRHRPAALSVCDAAVLDMLQEELKIRGLDPDSV